MLLLLLARPVTTDHPSPSASHHYRPDQATPPIVARNRLLPTYPRCKRAGARCCICRGSVLPSCPSTRPPSPSHPQCCRTTSGRYATSLSPCFSRPRPLPCLGSLTSSPPRTTTPPPSLSTQPPPPPSSSGRARYHRRSPNTLASSLSSQPAAHLPECPATACHHRRRRHSSSPPPPPCRLANQLASSQANQATPSQVPGRGRAVAHTQQPT